MPKRLAINGYGRIGRALLRALYERGLQEQLQIVAINDLGIAESLLYETQYDSVHGHFPLPVAATQSGMSITDQQGNKHNLDLYQQDDPKSLPWQDIDLVLEC